MANKEAGEMIDLVNKIRREFIEEVNDSNMSQGESDMVVGYFDTIARWYTSELKRNSINKL